MVSLAFSGNKRFDVIHEGEMKQIVVNTGPSFKSVVGLLLLGGALGAAGVCYLKREKTVSSHPSKGKGSTLLAKGSQLAKRAGSALSRAQDAVASIQETISPALHEALAEARATAQQTESELQQELNKK